MNTDKTTKQERQVWRSGKVYPVGPDYQTPIEKALGKLVEIKARLKVKDLGDQFTLIQDSQDIKATLDSIGKSGEFDFTGCLFAEIQDGDYGKVYLCPTFIPYLDSPVRHLNP